MANYFIIGADRKEYGPVSTDEVRKWIAEGRADAQTQVRADGTTEWLPLSAVPELGDGLKKTAPPPPPTIGALPTAGKTSALAVTSLVLGILALPTCGATALFGLICGMIALVSWNAHGGPDLLAAHRHRRNVTVVAFADGHVEVVSDTRLHSLRWDP